MEHDSTYYESLIAKHFDGEIKPEEMTQLSQWLSASVENQKLFDEYRRVWLLLAEKEIEDKIDIGAEWNALSRRIETGKTKIVPLYRPDRTQSIRRILRIAAMILVLLGSAFLIRQFIFNPSKEMQLVAQNEAIDGTLPDGTQVSLNRGSVLEYPSSFGNGSREVSLNGEAYFSVTHDIEHPFIVAAGDVRIEVLGTEFYINTQAVGNTVEVILKSGRVAVYYQDQPETRTILEPGERVIVPQEKQKIEKSSNDNANYLAWKTRRMVFNDERLDRMVNTLNRVYFANISLSDPAIGNCRITASFENQPLDAILNVLRSTLDLEIKKSSTGYVISGKPCEE